MATTHFGFYHLLVSIPQIHLYVSFHCCVLPWNASHHTRVSSAGGLPYFVPLAQSSRPDERRANINALTGAQATSYLIEWYHIPVPQFIIARANAIRVEITDSIQHIILSTIVVCIIRFQELLQQFHIIIQIADKCGIQTACDTSVTLEIDLGRHPKPVPYVQLS